jgi:hypothetical protein
MKAEEFVAKLATLEPPLAVEKRTDAEPFADDALVDLVLNWEIADFDFGDVSFSEEAFEDETTFEVGMYEEKYIIVDRRNGEVRVEKDDEDGTIVFSCAASSEKFLDALWLAIQYFAAKLNEQILHDDDLDKCENKAYQCAEAAGDKNDYFPFYQDFLNCYES